MNSKRKCFTVKINERRYLCTGTNEFKKGYRSRTTLVEDEKDDLLQVSKNS